MIAEDRNEVKLDELRIFLQTAMQKALLEIASETADMANTSGGHLGDFAFSAGSSLASLLYELLSDENTTCSGQIPQFEYQQQAFLDSFVNGFKEKLDILKDPELLKEVVSNATPES